MIHEVLLLAAAFLSLGGHHIEWGSLQLAKISDKIAIQGGQKAEIEVVSRNLPSWKRQSSSRSDFECEVDNDLIMVLDSSVDMKENDFKKAKVFLADFAEAFNSHKQNRIGFKVFAVEPQTIFELTNIHTPSEMRTHILSAPYFGNASLEAYFPYALVDSYNEFKVLNRSIVDQNFVLITAGPSQEPESISFVANKMIKAGVNNFAVGIGERIVESQLLAVTGNKYDNLLLATDFSGLKGILGELIHRVCSDKVPVCHGKHELMISMDVSSSIRPNNFKLGKQFVAKLFDSFVMSGTNRVSLRIFSSRDKSIFKLDNSLTRAQIQSAVLNTNTEFGYTRTDLTLDAGIDEFKQLSRQVSKNFLIVTDGKSEFPLRTYEAAKRAKAAGINTFAVGIGSVLDAELLNIANGDSKRVFKFESKDELEKTLKKVSAEICNKKL